jgi:hypothetical protein
LQPQGFDTQWSVVIVLVLLIRVDCIPFAFRHDHVARPISRVFIRFTATAGAAVEPAAAAVPSCADLFDRSTTSLIAYRPLPLHAGQSCGFPSLPEPSLSGFQPVPPHAMQSSSLLVSFSSPVL